MAIKKIIIKNFKIFKEFDLELNDDLNIIVGDNETGKSTLLEAINLALTGQINGKNITYEISPYIFNKETVENYIDKLKNGEKPAPPKILIELYFDEAAELAKLRGNNNSLRENDIGIFISIEFDEEYNQEYEKYIEELDKITTLPTEYYTANWYSFGHSRITKKSLPINTTSIDATTIRLQYGTDYYIQKIIDECLDPKGKTALTMAYRRLKESFAKEESLANINKALKEARGKISDKEFKVSIDISQKTSWETNLTSYLDDIPFQFIGKGDQNEIKMLLALDRKADFSHIILIEEPENHLSFLKMNGLIKKIKDKCVEKQLIIATHSTFVLNKLGIEKVIILGENLTKANLKILSQESQDYFKKLPGYDTLRLLIAKKSILVEGPSDELFVQKAYFQEYGKLPIEDEIDVISINSLAFKRFLEIAKLLMKSVTVITDNDGDYNKNVEIRYKEYISEPNINICYDKDNICNTLEPQIVKHNDLKTLNEILGKEYSTKEDLLEYMENNKTKCALRIFESEQKIKIPKYIKNAIT